MSGYYATAAERAEYIAGMRALLDFLDAHPEIPTSRYESIQLSTRGETMADRMATVDEFADLTGVKPGWRYEGEETHYHAQLKFGPIEFFCVAIKHAEDFAQEAAGQPASCAAEVSDHTCTCLTGESAGAVAR